MDDPFPKGMIEDIERFFSTEESRQPGLSIYHDVFDTSLFFPLQRQAELAAMIEAARRIEPRVIAEIGSDKGGGLYHWVKCLPTVKRAIACEVRGTPYAAHFESAFPKVEFLWLDGSSYDSRMIAKVDEWLIKEPRYWDMIDILFIDGDKSTFLTDFNNFKYFMSRDGIVFMHDIQDGAPRAAFKYVSQFYRTMEIIDISDYHNSILRGGDPISAHDAWLRHWEGRSAGVGVVFVGQPIRNRR